MIAAYISARREEIIDAQVNAQAGLDAQKPQSEALQTEISLSGNEKNSCTEDQNEDETEAEQRANPDKSGNDQQDAEEIQHELGRFSFA